MGCGNAKKTPKDIKPPNEKVNKRKMPWPLPNAILLVARQEFYAVRWVLALFPLALPLPPLGPMLSLIVPLLPLLLPLLPLLALLTYRPPP